MPRIADRYIDCAVYIYGSVGEARVGQNGGGSGFIAIIPFFDDPGSKLGHTYIITNEHVVEQAMNPVIRLNRKDGSTEVLETKTSEWRFHPDGDDIAVLPFDIEEQELRHSAIPTTSFATKSIVETEDVGIGDDTVMVGRFIGHDGKQQNTPSVRFGNIAMMPKEKIKMENGRFQEGYLVETRSLPGYSGSAVLIYSPCAMNDMSVRRLGIEKRSIKPLLSGRTVEEQGRFAAEQKALLSAKGPYLLGIDFSHLPKVTKVLRQRDGRTEKTDYFIQENTGMAGVIPAWRILEVLYSQELIEMRKKTEEQLAEQSAGGAILDSAEAEPVFTQSEFEDALKKVSRKIAPDKEQ